MTKNLNLREALALIGNTVLENWEDRFLAASALPSPDKVDSIVKELKEYARQHGVAPELLLKLPAKTKRHIKGLFHPTLANKLGTQQYPSLKQFSFVDGMPQNYQSAYFAYATLQNALQILEELLVSEKLAASYTEIDTAKAHPLPSNFIKEGLVAFNIANNRIEFSGQSALLSIPKKELEKLLQSKQVIASLQHTKNNASMVTNRIKKDAVLLPPDEVASRLGLATKTLAMWRSAGKTELPFIKLPNGRIRYKSEDVESFIQNKQSA